MSGRIIVLGATGYTGGLAARALADAGLRPVLAGRRPEALESLAADLGGVDTAAADVARPATVRALVERGDVLVTTVGPMARLGSPALDAAIDAGAGYVDSTGESGFVRKVFEQAHPRARAAGSVLLPAMAYDSVPGNLAGALALEEAGTRATGVRIGYFVTGARRGLLGGLRSMSGGSRTTLVTMALEPGFALREGRIVSERGSARVGVFDMNGSRRRGVSFGTTEGYSLPRLYPGVRDVEVYFGWFDGASRIIQLGSLALAGLRRSPHLRAALERAGRALGSSARAATHERTGSLFVADALDAGGRRLARVELEGINGYRFSGRMLAWAAARVAAGEVQGSGALGPVEAFGLERLTAGVAECGITAT